MHLLHEMQDARICDAGLTTKTGHHIYVTLGTGHVNLYTDSALYNHNESIPPNELSQAKSIYFF